MFFIFLFIKFAEIKYGGKEMSTAQLECLLDYINSLNLSLRSRKWLSEKLIEPVDKSDARKKKKKFLPVSMQD